MTNVQEPAGGAVALVQARRQPDQVEICSQEEPGKERPGPGVLLRALLEQPGRQVLPTLPFCGFPPADGAGSQSSRNPVVQTALDPCNP